MTRPPRIGATTYREPAQWGVWTEPADLLPASYSAAIRAAGGIAVLLPPAPAEHAEPALYGLDGLLVAGGPDVDPARYGAAADPHTGEPRSERDGWELALVRAALGRDLPLLAVCRGMQVLNVALGGSLIQHVPAVTGQNHDIFQHWHEGVHMVKIEPDSNLAEALGCTEVSVNSMHHQAVYAPAPGTRPVAWAEDDTVEAIELADSPHVVAVQWHPELLEDAPEQQGLFRQLVDRAAEVANQRGRS